MVDTTTTVTTGEDTTTNPPVVQHKPPPSYGFVNPAAFNSQKPPPPVPYIQGQQFVSPPQNYSPVVYAQPMGNVGGLNMVPAQTAGINDYMAWSIFNICCCGLLPGFIGMMLSSMVRDRKMAGDVEGAKSISLWTAIWNGFSTLAGIGVIIYLVIYMTSYNYV